MRPVRIELSGFAAYRAAETVDFEGVEFFSLTGPTGSGKSSLVDAMVFALFGRVPRLGGNAVAPAIAAGTDQARVRFHFEVGDVLYDATRLAVRTPSGGATVREARLQRGETVLADGADDVTREVESLLRLRFEDFTRTVVLPQGEFARFLTATKAERQGLLRNLLGLDVYTRVRELARTRAAVASERSAGDRSALEALDLPDDEARLEAVERRDALVTLANVVADSAKVLVELERSVETADGEERRLHDAVLRLTAIETPTHLDELDALAASARSAVSDAEAEHDAAVRRLSDIEAAISALPRREQIQAWERARTRLAEVTASIAAAGHDEAVAAVAAGEERLAAASQTLDLARAAVESGRREHAAHTLAATLEVGAPCPVCARPVDTLPARPEVAALTTMEQDGETASAGVERARDDVGEARARLAGIEASLGGWSARSVELEAELGGTPDPAQLQTALVELDSLDERRSEAMAKLVITAAEVEKCGSVLESLADDARQAGKRLTTAQLSVADLDPPVPESDDVVVQWKELMAWRAGTLEMYSERARAAVEARVAAEATAADARVVLITELERHGIDPIEPFAVAVATALQTARASVDAQVVAVERAAELSVRIAAADTEAAVAESLAGHLKSNGFEQWLMVGALGELVDGANQLLDQLSGGGYALRSDDSGTFTIVDRRNAGEIRSVATLSGGETFLVSLALALSLAETLAAKGGSGLDAIILDEGFGSLDEESLDTVATVLEELTGRGLMVGVITHVKELAARAPVRYEVSPRPEGATVAKVET